MEKAGLRADGGASDPERGSAEASEERGGSITFMQEYR